MVDASPRAIWVSDSHRLRAVCDAARRAGVAAVDTESNSLYAYHARLCVVQLSCGAEHAVVDTLALGREELRPLVSLLADPGVVKILHGADYDVRSLDRELGARVVGLRDTQAAAQLLGLHQTGLGALVAAELGVTLDKRHQLADWAQRPLPPELLAYAAADTAYLTELARRLEQRLEERGRQAWWLEECAVLEAVRSEPVEPDPLSFERVRGAGRLKGVARDRLAALHAWREGVAEVSDRPPFKVMSADVMLHLAQTPPQDLEALGQVRGLGSGTVRRHGPRLLALLETAPPAPERVHSPRPRQDPVRLERVRLAAEVRDRHAAALEVEPAVLAPRAALEAVVDGLPQTLDALRECLGRRWRAAVLGEDILALVTRWRDDGKRDADPQ